MAKARLTVLRDRALPKGWFDAARQLLLFAVGYRDYQLVRGTVNGNGDADASWNATKLINLERSLHVFVEPDIQAWAVRFHWLIDFADVTYLYSQGVVAFGVLTW